MENGEATIPSGVLGIVGDGGDSRTLKNRASLGHECAIDGKRTNRARGPKKLEQHLFVALGKVCPFAGSVAKEGPLCLPELGG